MRSPVTNLLAALMLGGFLALANAADAVLPAPTRASDANPATTVSAPAPGSRSTRPQFRVRPVDDAWRTALPRGADLATQAYLDRLPVDVVARSNDYFEGGYWLQLWNFLLGLLIALVLLSGQRAARMRNWAQRVGRKGFLRDAVFGAIYAAAAWLLSLPLTIYQGFVREHVYAMATQTFGPWFAEQLIGLAVSAVSFALLAAVFYAVLRRAGDRWWLWGTLVAIAFFVLSTLVGPVLIDPLFNTYKPVADGAIKHAVLAMAQADGVPADNVYEFDASRQTTRVSANVSGIFGSASVRLNDNLLRRSSLPEIRAVMGHELGHYVLNHIYKMIAAFALLFLLAFLFTQWAMARLLARYGARWGLRGVSDVAGFPLLLAVVSVAAFVATPISNTIIRTQEIEADRFGLNLAREPHGAAEVDLKLTEYRKPDPTPLEEFIFFDHPSTRFRIYDAMRWREAMGTP
ncbi:MAG: M48 family metallopeptidase [Pseudomonadota bacterium]|nr:M48 family metallopeptidase [Pseudomonadota bacterium]